MAKGGGSVWLVVRNPAFGALPFRVYTWQSRGGQHDNGGVSSNAIVVAAEPITKHPSDKALPILKVPAALFLPDPAGWDRGETSLRAAGWSEK